MTESIKVSALTELSPGGIFPAACPTRALVDHATSKWGILILISLSDGVQRWGELRRRIGGISEKMLAQTLRTLESDGLIHREPKAVIPPHVDYRLSAAGEEVAELLIPLLRWANRQVT